MEQIKMEVTPYQKMRIFGGSGRISSIITEDGYNNLLDLMGKAMEEIDTGQYESFEKLTLHKEKGCLGTPAGDIQLLINFLGWMVQVLDEKETDEAGSNLPFPSHPEELR